MKNQAEVMPTDFQRRIADSFEEASPRALFMSCCSHLISTHAQLTAEPRSQRETEAMITAEAFTYEEVGDAGLEARQIFKLTHGLIGEGRLYSILEHLVDDGQVVIGCPAIVTRIETLSRSKKIAARMVLGLLAAENKCPIDSLLPLAEAEEREKQICQVKTGSQTLVYWRGPQLGGRLLRAV